MSTNYFELERFQFFALPKQNTNKFLDKEENLWTIN